MRIRRLEKSGMKFHIPQSYRDPIVREGGSLGGVPYSYATSSEGQAHAHEIAMGLRRAREKHGDALKYN